MRDDRENPADQTLDWCSLSIEDKILLVLGAYGEPMPMILLEFTIWIMDKIHKCNEKGGGNGS